MRGKKLTRVIFIERADKKHNHFYGYDNVPELNGINEKVPITCPIHGDFWQSPHHHLQGHGCPLCASTKLNWNIFVDRANLVHNFFYTYEHFEYINNKTKSWITCPIHGDFLQDPNHHLSGEGCPHCAGHIKKTLEHFIFDANLVHNFFYTYEHFIYVNNYTKSWITCPIHGDFLQTSRDHLSGHGCPECGYEISRHCCRKSTEQFIIEARLIHGDKYDYSKAVYINQTTPILIRCKKCGRWFWQTPKSHLKGCGCPFCNKSIGEENIEKYLIEHNLLFEREKKFKDCKNINSLPFDFYLPELNTCIEYDGEQHFKPIKCFGGFSSFQKTKVNDKIKTNYCLKNHIRIIRIKYTENVNNILDLYFKNYKTT